MGNNEDEIAPEQAGVRLNIERITFVSSFDREWIKSKCLPEYLREACATRSGVVSGKSQGLSKCQE
jgi:hypothetical protein